MLEDKQSRKSAVATLSVASNSLLVILKITVGLLIGSVSVLSEAIHSGVDLLAAVIAWFAVRTAGKPADQKHPFGHGKIENISGTIEALLIFAAAGWIMYEAVNKLLHPKPIAEVDLGVLVMLFSAAINFMVSKLLFKVGRDTDSMALQADAWHLRTDVWTSTGVMVGLIFIWAGQRLFPETNLQWMDPAAAMAVALLIIRASLHLTLQSGRDLMDASLSPEEEERIRKIIMAYRPPVCGFHKLRTRKSGAIRFVEFHLDVSGEMSVHESHCLTIDIVNRIESDFPGSSVTIHIEPCDGKCTSTCLTGCLLAPEAQNRLHTAWQKKTTR